MALPVLPNSENGNVLTPDKANYVVARAQGAVNMTKLDGGRGAYRRDKLGSSSLVTCTWSTSSNDYATLDTFFMATLAEGSLPCQGSIIIGEADLTAYKMSLIPDTWGIQSIEGDTVTSGGQFEVVKI